MVNEQPKVVPVGDVMLHNLIVATGQWGTMALSPLQWAYDAADVGENEDEREVSRVLRERTFGIFEEVAVSLLQGHRYIPKMAIRVLAESTCRMVYHDRKCGQAGYEPLKLLDIDGSHKALDLAEIRKEIEDERNKESMDKVMRIANPAVHAGMYNYLPGDDGNPRLDSLPAIDDRGQASEALLITGIILLQVAKDYWQTAAKAENSQPDARITPREFTLRELLYAYTVSLQDNGVNLGSVLGMTLQARGTAIEE